MSAGQNIKAIGDYILRLPPLISRPRVTTKLAPYKTIDGRYHLLNKPGGKQMSDVWFASDLVSGKMVVLKFASDKADSNQMLQLHNEQIFNEVFVLKELQGLQKLQGSPGTEQVTFPTCLGEGSIGAGDHVRNYVVMSYIDGIELSALMRERERIPLYRAIEITISVLYGLKQLARVGKIHRDIKPQNIRVNEKGNVYLFDFGTSRVAGFKQKGSMVAGTPSYIAPEQITANAFDIKADIYALGLVLNEMITGINPMTSKKYDYKERLAETIDNQRMKEMPDLALEFITARFEPDKREALKEKIELLHCQLKKIIKGMTVKDPKRRFGNLDAMISQLEKLKAIAKDLPPEIPQI